MTRRLLIPILILGAASLHAAEPTGYYSSCEGLYGQSLLEALEDVIGPHTTVSYSGLWSLYKKSDVRENGTIWDIYSTKEWTPGDEQCGSYSAVGDCYNREHSFPKSWFNEASPMYSDAFHIYPTDGKVNGQRSNYPYGECASGTTLASSGGVKALGRLGTSTFSGYTGKVFEPDDEYKGDLARSYFYMAACYNSLIEDWDSPMLASNSYPAYTTWAVNLLLKWHRQDPVSQKELDRNEVIYNHQENRNPFIDHPELAEYIWGDKIGQPWSLDISGEPAINTPVDGTSIDLGITAVDIPRTATLNVKGSYLTDDITLTISGEGFSASATSISASQACGENGCDVTITYLSSVPATASATLTIASGTARATVTLTATAVDGLPAQPATDITETSFIARWTNIDQDPAARYTISVCNLDGTLISDEYPLTVLASDEQFEVLDLTPATTYTYTISSSTLTSNVITVTTATPIPAIQLDCDPLLTFTALPQQASDYVEIAIWIENITDPVTIAVDAPFAVSTDLSSWATTIAISPDDDHFYLRLQPTSEGTYTARLTAQSADCQSESIDLTATVTDATDFIEDFEADATGMSSYNPTIDYIGTAATWHFSDAGIYTSDTSIDSQSARFGKTSASYIQTTDAIATGIGTVTLHALKWSNDADATLAVQTSTDGGNSWTTAGTVTITDNSTYVEFTVTANVPGPAYLRLQQTAGKRFNIDNITVTPCVSHTPRLPADRWTAYSRDHRLIIESDGTRPVTVYSIDGITRYAGTPNSPRLTLTLPAGHYIILRDNDTRRVLLP